MSEVAHEGERPADLTMALETLMRFGTLMLRAGDTAFRVRDWMSMIARGMGLDALSVNIALGGMTVTARRGGEHATLVSEIAPPGVNAWRLGALEHLARNTQPGMTPQELAAKLAKIEAEPPLYPLAVTVAAVGAASGAFCYLSGGNMLEVVAAITGSSVGQWLRSLLVRRRFNQYAVTALCAMVASGVYCLIAAVWTGAGFALPRHAPGFISSVLFLFPGFALVGNELRLALHDAGMDLASATFLGALSVGLMASLARQRMQQSRIVLTVPGIIIMVPGIYGFQTIVLLNQGDMLAAMQAAALGGFIVGAMSLGLTASRFITERRWLIES